MRVPYAPFSLLTRLLHTGFLRQWPALPTFGVFLTTKVLPVPHVNDTDRYVVSRVEVLPGFYGVAQYLGFRDQATLRIDEIVARIGEIEDRYPDADRRAAGRARIEQLVELARHPTHMCVLFSFMLHL
jgi:KUP system potassium uptake protein